MKSTETTTQASVEILHEAMDRGLHAIGIFSDFIKASIAINHDILLDELDSLLQGVSQTCGSNHIWPIENSWLK
jgi:hypothetical protein